MNSRLLFFILVFFSGMISMQAQDNSELFFRAARANDVKTLKEMLGRGFDVNTKNHYGVTALNFAADKGNLEVVNLLLEHGADPNLKDSFYGDTPLGWAIYKKNTAIILSMINHGGDIKNEDLVMSAAGNKLHSVVRLLLEKGAPGVANVLLASLGDQDTSMFVVALDYVKHNDTLLSEALVNATALKNEKFISLLKEAGAKLPAAKPEPAAGKIDPALAGEYISKEMSKAELVVADEALTAGIDGSPQYRMKYLTDTSYAFADFPGLSITIQKVAGKVTGITLVQPNRKLVYLKTTEPVKKNTGIKPVAEDHAKVEKPANWPAFRGAQAAGTADGQHPPVTWNAAKEANLKWKTYIPGLAHASPVVWGNRVFLITAQSSDTASEYRVGLFGDVEPANDSSSHLWKIYCLDKLSGKILWKKKTFEGIPRVKRHVKGSQANATPATDGKYVVAVFGSEGMVCYDFEGKEQWRRDLGILDAGWFFNDDTQWGPASSPVICGNNVIAQCDRSKDSFIAAYDLKTGNVVWKTMRDEISSWGTPTLCHGSKRDELVTNGSRFIRGYNPTSGEELWRLSPNSEITVGTPVFMDSLVFVTGGYPPVFPVYAIRMGGKGNISIADSVNTGDFVQWRIKRGGTYMPTPLVYNGLLYTLSNSGLLTCYQGSTGELLYKETIKGGGAFTASPVAADGKIFCASEEHGIFVIRAGREYELIATNPVNEICMATPAISGGMIFIRGQHHLFCFGVKE